jgi:hypothetical protein
MYLSFSSSIYYLDKRLTMRNPRTFFRAMRNPRTWLRAKGQPTLCFIFGRVVQATVFIPCLFFFFLFLFPDAPSHLECCGGVFHAA